MNIQFKSVVSNLIMLNAVVVLVMYLMPNVYDQNVLTFALSPWEMPSFRIWQLVSYMFMHGDFTHLLFNMFTLWIFGRQLEYDLGGKRFLTYYMITGIGAGALNLLVMSLTGEYGLTVGASGAVFGILLAFGVLHPNVRMMLLFFPVPIKAKWMVMGYGAIELFLGLTARGSNVAHFAHLGGMIFGLILLYYWKKSRKIQW